MMCRAVIIAVVALLAAMAPMGVSAGCLDVTSANADVPPEAVPVVKWPAAGFRIWECAGGQLVNASQITGKANYTAAAKPWTGGFWYIGTVARFVSKNGTQAPFEFDLDASPGLTPQVGKIADARWTVHYLDNNVPAAFKGEMVYLTRTNSTGGATPTQCNTTTQLTQEVPYTTTYTLYVCGQGKPAAAMPPAPAPSSAVSAGVGALAAVVVAVAVLF